MPREPLVSIRAPAEWQVRAKALAASRGQSLSEMLREAVDRPEVPLAPGNPPDVLVPVVPVTPGVALSALPPAGGAVVPPPQVVVETTTSDPVMGAVVSDGPKHWHRREPVETHWERGQKVTTYRCKDCGASLT